MVQEVEFVVEDDGVDDVGDGGGGVLRTIAWYHGMRRLRIRWERRDDMHEAFLGLATCIICYRHIKTLC
jgi:hypothetical protein